MKYKRQEICDPCLSALFGNSGVKFFRRPDLPKVKFKKGRRVYTVTDLRCLNEQAVNVLIDILVHCANTQGCESVSYHVEDIEKYELDLISDIVTAVEFEYRDKDRWSQSVFLASGTRKTEKANGEVILTFELIKEHADIIYNYALKHGSVNYFDLIPVLAMKEREDNNV